MLEVFAVQTAEVLCDSIGGVKKPQFSNDYIYAEY